jgi:pyrophosphatase PpaX
MTTPIQTNQSENNHPKQRQFIDTVLFDFDGTVMDTTDVIIGSWQHTFMKFEGRERPVEDIIKTFGEILSHTMKNVLPHVDTEEAIDAYRSYHRDNFGERISVFEGMAELLAELKKRNFKTGLVTSRLSGTTWEGLRQYNLAEYFDVVVSCDDTDKHKPDPTPVNIALERLGSKPENAIMLGDTKFDILCAKNAGVRSVLVGWHVAMTPEDINGDNGPDHIIEKAEDLFLIISEANQ